MCAREERTARYMMKWIETAEEKEKNTHSCREFFFRFEKRNRQKCMQHTADLKKLNCTYVSENAEYWTCECVCIWAPRMSDRNHTLWNACAPIRCRALLWLLRTHTRRIMRVALTIYLICNLQFRADKYIYYWKRPHRIYEMNQGNEYKYRFTL